MIILEHITFRPLFKTQVSCSYILLYNGFMIDAEMMSVDRRSIKKLASWSKDKLLFFFPSKTFLAFPWGFQFARGKGASQM